MWDKVQCSRRPTSPLSSSCFIISIAFLRAMLDQNLFEDDGFLYEGAPELKRFRTASPSIELLTDWYQSRAKDIDSCSRQVAALHLVLAKKESKQESDCGFKDSPLKQFLGFQ